jgi:hypothetical protein
MQPSSDRALRLAGVALAVVLVALALYPGTLASPLVTADDTPKYSHTIVPESASQYDEYTAGYDHDVYQYEDLSPVAQELFDRTRAAESGPNGERTYVPAVCRDWVLACDGYAEEDLPAAFTYGTELDYEEAFVFVEDGDERYLLQTGITGHLFLAPFPTGFALSWLTMLPLAGLVGALANRAGDERLLGGVVVVGAVVAALGVLAPYAELAGLVPAWVVGVVLLAGVWLAMLAVGGREVFGRVVADRGESGRGDV